MREDGLIEVVQGGIAQTVSDGMPMRLQPPLLDAMRCGCRRDDGEEEVAAAV